MKNLADLNEILFAQLDKHSDDTRTEEQRKADVSAAKEIKGIAMCITQNAALQIQAASLSRASSGTLDSISGISDIKQVPTPAPATKALDVMKDKGLQFANTSTSTQKKSANTLTPRAAARLKNS